MDIREIEPGLWSWTAPHPSWTPEKDAPGGWGQMVACLYFEAPDATVLIDPLAPPEGTPEAASFWAALDRDVARRARPVAVIIGNEYHGRSADAVRARYGSRPGVSVHAHKDGVPQMTAKVTHPITVPASGAALPGGITALSIPILSAGELLIALPDGRGIVVADTLLATNDGQLRVAPRSWVDDRPGAKERYDAEFRPMLRQLLDRPFDRLFVSHGPSVLAHAQAAVAKALVDPAWGA